MGLPNARTAGYTQPRREIDTSGRRGYTSRWKLVLMEYYKVRGWLLNSQTLLEDTNLALYNINDTTLRLWYKDSSRRDEVKVLLQGTVFVCFCGIEIYKLCYRHFQPTNMGLCHKSPHTSDTTNFSARTS